MEVSATTLDDDLTAKRELYAQLGVREYWVADTAGKRVWLFASTGDTEVLEPQDASQVLPELTAELLTQALRLGASEGDTAAIRFILEGDR